MQTNYSGKKVIVRAYGAGVFYGTFVEKEGQTVVLKDARRVYYWSGASDCNELAKWTKNRPLEERIADFCRLFPTSETTAKCSVFYDWHNILTGSCRMGRDQFVKEHGLDMDAEYTVEYFIKITRNAYGGDVIRQLEERYLGGNLFEKE